MEKLRSVLDELLARYDEVADIPADSAEHRHLRTRILNLEARVVTLTRPRNWRLRDLKTAGIRDLTAVGVTLSNGKLRYGDHIWPAAWSYASIEPGANPRVRTLSVGRVVMKSPVPLRKSFDSETWTEFVDASDLDAVLTLVACVNVSSRMRAATFPVGTYF